MKSFGTLLSNELRKLLLHANTYFIAALFLLIMGFNYLYILFFYSRNTMSICTLQSFFNLFWLPTLCVVPLLTMRSFSEDRRLGLLESLLSTPIGTHSLVLSKCLSIYSFYILLWCLSLIFPFFAHCWLKTDLVMPLVTPLVVLGGTIFIAITSFFFVSLGLLASSLTKSQSVAGLLCFMFLFACFVSLHLLSEHYCQPWNTCINFFKVLDDLCQGIFDLRPFLFFLLIGTFILELTAIVIEQKSLR